MAHLHSSRSRPEPLALHQSNSTNTHTHTNPNDRARLLSSLRSAPVPQAFNHQFQSQQQAQQHAQYANLPLPINEMQMQMQMQQPDPRSAAYAQFQTAQTAYLAELQRQIMVKQNEIWINQQQIEAEAAMRAMSLTQQENEREREWNVEMERQNSVEREEQQARSNPLVASALARRKRQSLNLEARQQQQQQSQTPPPSSFLSHERHSTPPTTCSPPPSSSTSSSVRSTPPPPAVILSAPGEPYPDTSSASGSESGDGTRPSSPSTHSGGPDSTESSPKLDDDTKGDKELKANRRRSHLDTLSNALGGRTKRRPVSMGGPPQSQSQSSIASPEIVTPRPNQLTFAHPPHPTSPNTTRSPRAGFTPRSVSDSHPILRSPIPSSPQQQGSQFASSSSSSHISVKPPTLPGHAYATRQPKGPPTNLLEGDQGQGQGGQTNFGTRIRQKAILDLRNGLGRGRERGRQSSLEVGATRVGVAC